MLKDFIAIKDIPVAHKSMLIYTKKTGRCICRALFFS
jgi:hypothetical protein